MATGSANSIRTQPVRAKASHLDSGLPSSTFTATSPAPAFSALAVAPVARPRTSPGMAEPFAPFTPAVSGRPSGPVSTVSTQSGSGWPGSNDDANRTGASAPAGGAATRPVISRATASARMVRTMAGSETRRPGHRQGPRQNLPKPDKDG